MSLLLAAGLFLVQANLVAEEAFYHVPWSELEVTEGTIPNSEETDWRSWQTRRRKPAYAVLEGEGEVYVTDGVGRTANPGQTRGSDLGGRTLVARTAAPRDLTGWLFAPSADGKTMSKVRFKVPAARATATARTPFFETQRLHYEQLMDQGAAGTAWFRHRAREAQQALGEKPAAADDNQRPQVFRGRWLSGDLSDTYSLFSGGRALSENLQLDRVLPTTAAGEETVDITTLRGIEVREIDWKPLVKDLHPKLDSLATALPFDQHAVLFPSFEAAVQLSDELAAQSALVLGLAEPSTTDARTFERYQQQLGLSLTGMARLLGPSVVKSVAVTGSDPYFRTGTDLAVLFEAADANVLHELILAQVALSAAKNTTVKTIDGTEEGLAYRGWIAPDRSVCSYVAQREGLVVVTNSLVQLRQLARVASGQTKALASLDEYLFFRHRYPLGDTEETALVFLSDATIRRWCGPHWRIATSRRTRDAAVLSEMLATQLDRLVAGKVAVGPLYSDLPLAQTGELSLSSQGVRSSAIGSLAFMTPISEMPIDRVTQAEATAYQQWRDRYQQNWSWAFDPIALRLTVRADKLAADLSVMPLIWGSEYRTMISVSQGATLDPNAGDRHDDALAHAVLAVNTESETFRRQTNMAQMLVGGLQADPLSWLGEWVSIYVDKGTFWDELTKIESDKQQAFIEEQGWHVPLGISADVTNGLKLTVFMAALRGFVEQVAPGMLQWESLTYQERPYVRVTPTERALSQTPQMKNAGVYYSMSGSQLTLSPNEDVLKRAIDREIARDKAAAAGQPAPQTARPWLGGNLALQVDQQAWHTLGMISGTEYQTLMQTRAWSNLTILNEWKRRYPDKDPVALHEQFWQLRLTCPGGGQYVWNEDLKTMESTVYGCPAAPRNGPLTAPVLQSIKLGSFGLTFEPQGLRARIALDR
jgi:hypothetical protein